MIQGILLLPFSLLYGFVVGLRNRLYDLRLKPSVRFDVPVVCVGNLVAGGAGKTPMVEYLIRLLMDRYNIAAVSRGYGRKTKGIRIANSLDNANTLGDEPYQFYRKYGQRIRVCVGEERAYAIPNVIHIYPETNLILLDDAFQHRAVTPSFSILLTDYSKPFYSDYLLPGGRLRESRSGARRADVVVVTKCPDNLSEESMMTIENAIKRYSAKRVFFSAIRYGYPVAFGKVDLPHDNVVLVTGVANAAPLAAYLKKHYKVIRHLQYGDHHDYSGKDLEEMCYIVSQNADTSIFTTEKDMVKLVHPDLQGKVRMLPLFYVPIEMVLVKNGADFDEIILNAVNLSEHD